MQKHHYEEGGTDFPAVAYQVKGHRGIAWKVMGWETKPDGDTEWSGCENRTGNVVCRMIGDDRRFVFEPDQVSPIGREDYCGECGQIGCTHDGLTRGD